MNNLNWNPKYRQKLRTKFFKWLTRIRNATLMQSDQSSAFQHKHQDHHYPQQQQVNLQKSDLRSVETRTLESSTYPLFESLSASDDYFYQNLTNTLSPSGNITGGGGGSQSSNSTTDFLAAAASTNSSLFDFTFFDANSTTAATAIAPSASVMHNNAITHMETTKMFSENATRLFDFKNITITDFNITTDNINDFLKKLWQLSKPLNETVEDDDNELSACQYYCNGFVKDLFGSYKSVHGYISLVVSNWFQCVLPLSTHPFSPAPV